MVKARIPETDEGIQDERTVGLFDQMARRLRDNGYLVTEAILGSGIRSGSALEIASGPGYLGLEWLKRTEGTRLIGLDISQAMIEVARRNAREYGLEDRVTYVHGDATRLPFEEGRFDSVFSSSALHEWASPVLVFDEIDRVLVPGGRYCVTDLRRDINPLAKWFLELACKPKEIRPGLISSINAAYTVDEAGAILRQSRLTGYEIGKAVFGLDIIGRKPG
jgi:ubiquinone/menaquinone biosynthesis C-methylase UbiE